MDKKTQLFAKVRLILYAVVIGVFAIAGVSLFVKSQFTRAKYIESNVQLEDARAHLEELKDLPDSYKKEKQVAWYSDLEGFFDKEAKSDYKSYKAQSIVSYTFTMLALVSFGVCLKVEDYFKSKEE